MEAGMGSCRKQQNGSRRGSIVAFFRGSRNGSLSEAAKWSPPGSHCCFLSWTQEWELAGSNKMLADEVPLLLFIMRAGLESCRKQQNVSQRSPIAAFYRGSRNGIMSEAAKWPPARFHCCFFSWEQEWDHVGSNKMIAGRV